MSVMLTCPQGHQWQLDDTVALPGEPQPNVCPICGVSAQTLPPEKPAGARSESDTLPPSPQPALPDPELYRFLSAPEGPDELGRLGNYRILSILGAGGMGVVFKAEDLPLQRFVAIKAMLPGIAATATNRERFMREARAAAAAGAIGNDHIVPIYNVVEANGVPFVVMPLLQGEPLSTRLEREGRLSTLEVLRIGRETADGLAAAHERGFIHRDVKPANLWLEGERGRVKILDFGLARALAGDGTQLTQSGIIMGTPAFMAPEQASGKSVDGRCDLFSLGCVLYRMCTGEMPFKGTDTISTLMAVAMEQPPPPRSFNPAVPPALSALVMQLLAKSPADRPASARAVVERLTALEKNQPVPNEPVYAIPIEDIPEVIAVPRDDEDVPVLEAVNPKPQPIAGKVLAPHERLLRRANALGAVVGVFVGMTFGRILDAITVGHTGPLTPLFIGGGAIAGYFLGPFIAKKLRRRRERQNSDRDN
jgi:serine/threonine protein kinase